MTLLALIATISIAILTSAVWELLPNQGPHRRTTGGKRERAIIIRLQIAVIELIKLDEESGGAVDLSEAIEILQRAIRELEEAQHCK